MVHDEILLECPQVTLKKTTRLLKKVMVEAGALYLQQVPVEVEVTISSSWAWIQLEVLLYVILSLMGKSTLGDLLLVIT